MVTDGRSAAVSSADMVSVVVAPLSYPADSERSSSPCHDHSPRQRSASRIPTWVRRSPAPRASRLGPAARVPVPAVANGATYMTLTNDGDTDDTLVSAGTDIAESVELHETTTQDGSMSMQEVDGIDIPAGDDAVLEPGGLHMMLIGVTEDLTEGDTVEVTLTFDNAGEQTAGAEVVPLGDMPGTAMGSAEMGMGSESVERSSEG